ncbi:MAG TPA: hypothetical protein VFR23_04250 [Jiangellaceae bacterium]|nr:hypothetical protein [Jiangellaceae bacterium]
MTEISRRHITAREAQDCLGIPAGTIRGWAKDEAKLCPVSIDANGERWYRLADVLELAATTRRRKSHCRPNRRRRDITRSQQDDACAETGEAA